ncbi:MAG: hypothetical protein HS101_18260 [Planctomycetia bacterium]|nr:hypothetical protein [Planctomycetia bacterium]
MNRENLDPSVIERDTAASTGHILPGALSIAWPELLTEAEAVRYLRLDTIRGLRNPGESLARYRAMGLLRGTQVSKSVFYRRVELDRFLERLTNENPR